MSVVAFPVPDERNQRWRRERHDHVMTGQQQQPCATRHNKGGKIRRSPPPGLLAETGGKHAVNANASPRFGSAKRGLWVIIRPTAAHHRDDVPALNQR